MVTWYVKVHTSDLRGAGTDANVRLVAYGKTKDGEYKKTDEVPLDNKGDNFEAGQCDKFKVEMDDVGKLYKIRIYHDNSGSYAGWHLDHVCVILPTRLYALECDLGLLQWYNWQVEMENMASKEQYTFKCNRWLAEDEDDGSIVREIPAEGASIKKPQPCKSFRNTA